MTCVYTYIVHNNDVEQNPYFDIFKKILKTNLGGYPPPPKKNVKNNNKFKENIINCF